MPFHMVRENLPKMRVDAVVHAFSQSLATGGILRTVFPAAGAGKQHAAPGGCAGLKPGESVLAKSHCSNAKYTIYTMEPVWKEGSGEGSAQLLACYHSALSLALQQQARSIAFPLLCAGVHGFSRNIVLQIAVSAIGTFLQAHEMDVFLAVSDMDFSSMESPLFSAIKQYIETNYIAVRPEKPRGLPKHEAECIFPVAGAAIAADTTDTAEQEAPAAGKALLADTPAAGEEAGFSQQQFLVAAAASVQPRSLEDVMKQLEESFSQMLLRLIDEKGKSDVETYKRANIDRKLFSKIRSNKNYSPSKATAIAFAVALELNLDETLDLLRKAGYTLSHSSKFDLIIEFFILQGKYHIYEINEALFAFEQPLLGA